MSFRIHVHSEWGLKVHVTYCRRRSGSRTTGQLRLFWRAYACWTSTHKDLQRWTVSSEMDMLWTLCIRCVVVCWYDGLFDMRNGSILWHCRHLHVYSCLSCKLLVFSFGIQIYIHWWEIFHMTIHSFGGRQHSIVSANYWGEENLILMRFPTWLVCSYQGHETDLLVYIGFNLTWPFYHLS
jgi:hypothetical protein